MIGDRERIRAALVAGLRHAEFQSGNLSRNLYKSKGREEGLAIAIAIFDKATAASSPEGETE